MKKLNVNQMESLTGGVCEPANPNSPFNCQPNICFGTAVALAASGNTNVPLVICIL